MSYYSTTTTATYSERQPVCQATVEQVLTDMKADVDEHGLCVEVTPAGNTFTIDQPLFEVYL